MTVLDGGIQQPPPHPSFPLTVKHQENKARRRGRWGVAAASLCQIQLRVEREVGLERGGGEIKSLSIKCHTFK